MLLVAVHVLIQIALIAGVLLRLHREPASRFAWVVVIVSLPILGILAYLLLGEINIGRRRVARLPDPSVAAGLDDEHARSDRPSPYVHLRYRSPSHG